MPGKNPNREFRINRRELVQRLMPAGGGGFALTGMPDGHYKDLVEIQGNDILTSCFG